MARKRALGWPILFIFMGLILFPYCNILNANEYPRDPQHSINKWELDKLSLMKKRYILNFERKDINNDDVIDLASKFSYLNDYIAHSLISIEKAFQALLSPEITRYLVSHEYDIDAFAGEEAVLYFKNNVYANYTQKLLKLNRQLEQCTTDKINMKYIVLAAGATGTASLAALSAMSTAGTTAAISGGTALFSISAGAALSSPVIVIAAPLVVGAAVGVSGYYLYRVIKRDSREREFEPIIDKASVFFDVPMDDDWKKAILAYLDLQKERGQLITLIDLYYKNIQRDVRIIPGRVLEFGEIVRNNELEYYKYDAMLRYYLFDQPLQILMLITNLKIDVAKGILNDDENKILSAGRIFGRCSRLIDYTANQETRDLYAKTTKRFKKELSKNEVKEIDSIIQMSLDWLKEPSSIQIKAKR